MPDTLKTGFNPATPLTVCVVPTGEALFANGLDKPQRWDGYAAALTNAGMPRAAKPRTATFNTHSTYATAKYFYAAQFFDKDGILGDMSTLNSFVCHSYRSLTISGIPTSTDPRVVGRYVYVSTNGQSVAVYKAKTLNNNTTTISTMATQTLLASVNAEEQRILNPDGSLAARRFGIPPSDRKVVVFHQDRTFWAVDGKYNRGNIQLTSGASTITGIGVRFTQPMQGRKLHIKGTTRLYTFNTYLTTTTARINPVWGSATDLFAEYSIEPARANRDLVYFSEATEPESVPSTNAVRPQADGAIIDKQTGLMQLGSFLHILSERHIYRWTFLAHPVTDGAIFRSANRGCVGQRCWCSTGDVAYLLDRQGPYRFNGSVTALETAVQDMFRRENISNPSEKIRWDNVEFFHSAYYPGEDVARFFVCLDGSLYPRHAICIQHQTGQFWLEHYPWEVAASCVVPVSGLHRLLLGSEHEKVLLYGEGTLDGPASPINARLAVTASTANSVTVATGNFTNTDIYRCQIQIVGGRGKGQTRRIMLVSSGKITVNYPWNIQPDTTSTVQIAGVPWRFKTGVLKFVPIPSDTYREYRVEFDPTPLDASFDMRSYLNRSDTPVNNSQQVQVSETVEAIKNSPDVEVDMKLAQSQGDNDGQAWWRFDDGTDPRGPANRRIALELRGWQNGDAVIIHEIRVDGVQ